MDSGISEKWSVFSLVAVGVFLSTMDSSMINVALPSIMRSFETTLARSEWVVLIYLLTITVSLLFWGRVGDQYGKGESYLLGMLVFTVGSFACFFASALWQLVGFRLFQAIGASMMMATGPALIARSFPAGQLGMALGFIGIATSLGLMCGPVVSGFLVASYSWPSIFLATVPVSLSAFVFGWFRLLPKLRSTDRAESATTPFDWYGMVLWTVMISSAVLLSTQHHGVSVAVLLLESAAMLLCVFFFLRVEAAQKNPLFPLKLFGRRSYAVAIFCAALSFAVLFVVLILMPFYLDYILHLTVRDIGFVMLAVPASVFLVSPISGVLFDRIGARFLTTAGLGLCACALLLLCFLSGKSSIWEIVLYLALLGAGQALFLSPNSASVLEQISPQETGVSSGMLATARNLGMLAGVSLGGLIFAMIFSKVSGGSDLKHFQPDQAQYFLYALRVTFTVTAVGSVFGAVLSGMRGTGEKKQAV